MYKALFCVACILSLTHRSMGQVSNIDWPKAIPLSDGGSITIYQPQPESLAGAKVTGRAAVSVKKTAKGEPVFGAIFFEATLSTDKTTRTAELQSVTVTNAKFPGVEDTAKLEKLTTAIETEVPKWNMKISLDALVASIEQDNPAYKDQFNNDPPTIYYRNRPTTLILIDGDPKIQKDKDLDADRVMNTPSLIFKEGSTWNTYAGGLWYKSSSIQDGWQPNNKLSKKLKSIDEQIKKQAKEKGNDSLAPPNPEVTDILVSTKPAELLQTKGEANYKTLTGTSLLYIANSPNDIFKDIVSQKTYILLSGRWYSAPSLNGPWTYTPADQLPADFARIPDGSDKDGVLSNVAGTDEAAEARIDAQIPQTAKVDRQTASVTVTYDGQPRFSNIENTSLQLAENASVTVIQDATGNYYALDNGVWFISQTPNGPWAVANDRPSDVDKIPPSSSAYNTKYVYVYETTPDYVYVGYTPGYLGNYCYGPTVVYGTGFYYRPWYGSIFYPRPLTWGFGFTYNPWYGWSINPGFGWSWGWGFGFGFGWSSWGRPPYYGGWFGPPSYRPPYRRPNYGGGYYRPPGYRPPNYRPGGGGIRPATGARPVPYAGNNLYRNQAGVTTREANVRPSVNYRPGQAGGNGIRPGTGPATRPVTGPSTRPGTGPTTRPATGPSVRPGTGAETRPEARPIRQPNNTFSDRNGNTYQRDNNGNWNQRDNRNNNWRPATRDNPVIPDLNRDNRMRDRGNMRSNNFNPGTVRPAPRPSAPRPSMPSSRPARPAGGPRRG